MKPRAREEGGSRDSGFHVVSTTKRRYHEAHGVVALPSPRIDVVDGVERAQQPGDNARSRAEQTLRGYHADGDAFTRPIAPRHGGSTIHEVSKSSIVATGPSASRHRIPGVDSRGIRDEKNHVVSNRRRQSLSITSYNHESTLAES